ncbi:MULTISPECIES: glycosyltransferase family 4 protein [unclassified Afipia]|uniref:glycosyltransferase n=1 Tax=unclassified Afipia TaxID=2642050 RepID=UPI000466254B
MQETPKMSSVRVLCVTPFGPSGKGGIDRLYHYFREFIAEQTEPGIDLRFAQSRGDARGILWIATFPLILAKIGFTLSSFRPHVVHINFATGGSLPRKYAILKLARAFGARTIVHFHGQFIEDQVAARTVPGRLFSAIANQADCVVALGKVHADAFERIGVQPQRIVIVPNGIPDFAADLPLPKQDTGSMEILFSGLLTENKGMHVLIPALARLRQTTENWHCTVAGNGDVQHFVDMAHKAGLDQKMTFTGWIEASEMLDHMRNADVVVLPSRTEALPLSLIEGACAGAALVATDVGNVRDIVEDGVNGLLVAREPEPIASALLEIAANRSRLGEMQSASRQIYQRHFTLSAFAQRLRELYRQIAKVP